MQARPLRVAAVLGVACAVVVAAGGHYTVQPGDTLSGIAARAGARVAQLVELNGLENPDHLEVGQELALGGSSTLDEDGVAHEVRPGETLSELATRYRTSIRAIARASRLSNPNLIRAGQRVIIPNAGPTVPDAAAASRAEIATVLEHTAAEYGWNPAFVKALAWQESGWNPRAVSHTGAVGLMQVLPSTGRFISRELVGRSLDLSEPADNAEAGVAFLDYLWQLTGGDPQRTLAGYYQGLRSVRRHGMAPDTERYVHNVLALRARF